MNPKKKKAVLITYWWCWNPAKTSWDPPCNQFRGRPSHFQEITTAWLGLTIPTPSGKQCQGRGWVDDRDILYLYYKGSLGSIKTGHENHQLVIPLPRCRFKPYYHMIITSITRLPTPLLTPLPHNYHITHFLKTSTRSMAQYPEYISWKPWWRLHNIALMKWSPAHLFWFMNSLRTCVFWGILWLTYTADEHCGNVRFRRYYYWIEILNNIPTLLIMLWNDSLNPTYKKVVN